MYETDHHHKNTLFYTRRDNEVHGPFPAGQITRYLLLGRVKLSDEISEDHESWQIITNWPELIPDVMHLDMSIAENREKLEAAKRWADERRLHRSGEPDISERRTPEQEELLVYRETREKVLVSPKQKLRGSVLLMFTLLVVTVVVWTAIRLTPEQSLLISDCSTSAAPGIIWNNCVLDGKQLSGQDLSGARIHNASLVSVVAESTNFQNSELQYSKLNLALLKSANLEGANLVGVSLRDTDLQGANLRGADLSYADLTDANLQGANLSGAKLDQTRWVDGTLCAQGSVGQCN
ncbi:MAG: pentapeptide repeat-containing protein [Gammaproteobacteria bacterium]|nr:pentapeptide repeat-containing protein [Gammaproteobacteria bacterium]